MVHQNHSLPASQKISELTTLYDTIISSIQACEKSSKKYGEHNLRIRPKFRPRTRSRSRTKRSPSPIKHVHPNPGTTSSILDDLRSSIVEDLRSPTRRRRKKSLKKKVVTSMSRCDVVNFDAIMGLEHGPVKKVKLATIRDEMAKIQNKAIYSTDSQWCNDRCHKQHNNDHQQSKKIIPQTSTFDDDYTHDGNDDYHEQIHLHDYYERVIEPPSLIKNKRILLDAASSDTTATTVASTDPSDPFNTSSNLNVKLDTVTQRLAMLETHLGSVQYKPDHERNAFPSTTSSTNIQTRIENLIPCAGYGSFDYYHHDLIGGFVYMFQSRDLVRKILTSFAAGVAYNVSGVYSVDAHSCGHYDRHNYEYDNLCENEHVHHPIEEEKESRDIFRAKLLMQLKHLIGHLPFLEEEDDGSFTLYYC